MNESVPTNTEPAWEQFAQEDPLWYIDMAHNGDPERFWRKGRESAEHLLDRAEPYLAGEETVIDIGCGVGRLLLPMASHFRHLVGVDIAPTMLERLQANASERGVTVDTYLPDGLWDEHDADLLYSKIVFRHIDERSVIQDYIRRISAALKPSGVAVLDFDTRPETVLYRLRNHAPDALLPRAWQENARGTRRSSQQIRQWFYDCDLRIADERDPESGAHEFILVPGSSL